MKGGGGQGPPSPSNDLPSPPPSAQPFPPSPLSSSPLPSPPPPSPSPSPPLLKTLSGKAFYNGYLAGCTVFLDINENGVHDDKEVHATTTDFGAYSLTMTAVEADNALMGSTLVVIKPSDGCKDTSTDLVLPITLKVKASCANVGLITAVQTLVHKSTDDAKKIINYGLDVEDVEDFSACDYDPFSYVWAQEQESRRRLNEQTTFQNYATVNLEIATMVKTLSDVTGGADETKREEASEAILQGNATS